MIRNSKGMTLVELMVVVALVGILSAMAIPLLGLTPRARLKSAARDLISDLQVARVNAIRDGLKWRISFDAEKKQYTVMRWIGPQTTDYTTDKIVNLTDSSTIKFGSGHGAIPNGADPGDDGITFTGSAVTFQPDGGATGGAIYIMEQNSKDTIAISVLLNTGRIHSRRHFGGNSWEEGKT